MQEIETSEGADKRERAVSPLAAVFSIFVVAAGVLWFVTQMAEKRGGAVLLRRYCDDPARHVALVGEILTKEKPAGENKRRPYIIAAKLLYIVQRNANEPVQAYLDRLQMSIAAACH